MPQHAPSPQLASSARLRRRITQMKATGHDTAQLEREVLELEYGDTASLDHGEAPELDGGRGTLGAVADVDDDTPLHFTVMEAVNAQAASQREERALLLNGVHRDERDATIYSALRAMYTAAHVAVALGMAYISYRATWAVADGLVNLMGGW